MRHIAIAVLALTATTGCNMIPGLGAALGPKVRVDGRAYVPATQTAMVAAGAGNIVAAGGMNYLLTARPDETGLPGAKVTFEGGGTAQTDTTGKFTVEVAGNHGHKATVEFALKSGGNVKLVAAAPVGPTGGSLELDTAAYLLGSKAAQLGKSPDYAKMQAALVKLRTALQTASKVPNFQDQAGGAAAFDATADAETKALVNAF